MKYSYFITNEDYKRYDSLNHKYGNDDYLGRTDSNGDCWKCCMPKEDADKAIADHTNKDGHTDYNGFSRDLGFAEGTFDENSRRVDFETDGEVRPTSKDSPNANEYCTGDGKLPGGYSDLEAKNVSRENITQVEKLGDLEKSKEHESQDKESSKDTEKQVQNESSDNGENEDYDYYYGQGY